MAKLEGLSHGTHVYNAMRGLHHREAGVLGAIMLLPDIYAELILDGIHVSADSARILCDIKGYKRINLITDSMRAAGLDDGVYDLGGQDVTVIGNEARLASGALAGSLLTMDIGFKNAINMLGVTVVQAANMSSTNQAGELNLIDRGVIDVDKLADLIIMDKDYNIKSVYKAGIKAC
jgi:N-acetylglucosamine-6-phosphate deacetylase